MGELGHFNDGLLHKIADGSDIEPLLKAGANPNQLLMDGFNSTPVHIAAQTANKKALCLLIRYHADVNVVSKGGYTPLMRAMKKGDVETVHLLLEAGAYINAKDDQDRTVLWWAAFYGQSMLIPLLKDKKAVINGADLSEKLTALMVACKYADSKTVNALISAGADVNQVSAYGYSALTFAILNENKNEGLKIAKILILAGADIHSKQNGSVKSLAPCPLVMATIQRHIPILKLLLLYQAKGIREAFLYAKKADSKEVLAVFATCQKVKELSFKISEIPQIIFPSKNNCYCIKRQKIIGEKAPKKAN